MPLHYWKESIPGQPFLSQGNPYELGPLPAPIPTWSARALFILTSNTSTQEKRTAKAIELLTFFIFLLIGALAGFSFS